MVGTTSPAYALRTQAGLESAETERALTATLTGLEEPMLATPTGDWVPATDPAALEGMDGAAARRLLTQYPETSGRPVLMTVPVPVAPGMGRLTGQVLGWKYVTVAAPPSEAATSEAIRQLQRLWAIQDPLPRFSILGIARYRVYRVTHTLRLLFERSLVVTELVVVPQLDAAIRQHLSETLQAPSWLARYAELFAKRLRETFSSSAVQDLLAAGRYDQLLDRLVSLPAAYQPPLAQRETTFFTVGWTPAEWTSWVLLGRDVRVMAAGMALLNRAPPPATGLEEPPAPAAPAVTMMADAAAVARLQSVAVGAWRSAPAALPAGTAGAAGTWLVFDRDTAALAPAAIAQGHNVAVIADDPAVADALERFLRAVPNPHDVVVIVGPRDRLMSAWIGQSPWRPVQDRAWLLRQWGMTSLDEWPATAQAIEHTDRFLAAIGV